MHWHAAEMLALLQYLGARLGKHCVKYSDEAISATGLTELPNSCAMAEKKDWRNSGQKCLGRQH
jgi:hypothetical protein